MKKTLPFGVFDVVIIGGGTICTATAYAISKTGLSVALLERGDIGSGTSGRCDGNVLICDKASRYDMALNKASLDLFPVIAQELKYDINCRQKGSLIIAENEIELNMCSTLCDSICADGYPAPHADCTGRSAPEKPSRRACRFTPSLLKIWRDDAFMPQQH